MKKTTAALLVLAMMLSIFSVRSALAANVTASVSPEALSDSGYVTVTFVIHNNSDVAMTKLSITGNDSTYDGEDDVIDPGETLDCVINNVYVSREQLGKEISFYITWREGDVLKNQMAGVVVHAQAADPTDGHSPVQSPLVTSTPYLTSQLTVVRTSDKTSAELGEKVKLTYVVTNTGAHTISGIALVDSEVRKGGAIFSNVTIEAGKNYTNEFEFEMPEADVTSKPVVTYEADGATLSSTTDPLVIQRSLASLEIKVEQGETTANGTDFTLTLQNMGNGKVTGITVKDELGTQIGEQFDMDAGASKVLTYHVAPDATREVKFTVAGTLSSGKEYTQTTQAYNVFPYTDPHSLGLGLSVTVVEPLKADGYATLTFTVINSGSLAMSNIELTEEQFGTVCKFKDLAPGESDSGTYGIYVGTLRDLVFELTSTDSNGAERVYNTIVSGDSISATATVAPSSTIDIGGNVGSTISDALVTILTILGILTGLAGAALIVLCVLEYREKKRLEEKKRAKAKRNS